MQQLRGTGSRATMTRRKTENDTTKNPPHGYCEMRRVSIKTGSGGACTRFEQYT